MNSADDFVLTGGRIVAPEGVLDDGWVSVSQGRIAAVGTGTPPAGAHTDVGGALVVPGFIDTHCHGGGGASFSTSNPAEARTVVDTHRASGTTTIVASLVSDPVDVLSGQLGALAELAEDDEIAGIHLEGPFISEARCGAHDPAALREPDTSTVEVLLDAGKGHLRMVTLAPELTGGVKAVRQLSESGVIAAIGHTDAVEQQLVPAIDAGATVATHLFNGMRPLHHREPGPPGVLLDDERITIELICDLVHVHPTMLRLAARHVGTDRTVLVTDAMSATGAADGRYTLGGLEVEVADGVALLPGTNTLAASTLTMAAAFRNLVVGAGLTIGEAVHATSKRPAELFGLADDVGTLRQGLRADLVVLDENLHPREVLRRGRWMT